MRWFQNYFVQGYKLVETGLPYPWDVKWELGDKYTVQAGFTPRNSTERVIAEAQGISTGGIFTFYKNEKVRKGDILLGQNGVFYRLIGDFKEADDFMTMRIKDVTSEIIDRPHDIEIQSDVAGLRYKVGDWLDES